MRGSDAEASFQPRKLDTSGDFKPQSRTRRLAFMSMALTVKHMTCHSKVEGQSSITAIVIVNLNKSGKLGNVQQPQT